jgi:hypothetical protein
MNEDKLYIISTTVHYESVKKTTRKKTTCALALREIYGLSIKQIPPCLHSNDMAEKQDNKRETKSHQLRKKIILLRNVTKEEESHVDNSNQEKERGAHRIQRSHQLWREN